MSRPDESKAIHDVGIFLANQPQSGNDDESKVSFLNIPLFVTSGLHDGASPRHAKIWHSEASQSSWCIRQMSPTTNPKPVLNLMEWWFETIVIDLTSTHSPIYSTEYHVIYESWIE